MSATRINKISINKFRGLENVDIELGRRITVICGKNGTSKSTILGICAQIFSFETDHSKKDNNKLNYRTIDGRSFKSNFSQHFRISEEHDRPGEMDISIDLFDGYFSKDIPDLKLALYESGDRSKARPVVRNNLPGISSTGNTSRNVTHPVIYLSLSRLMPIAERKKYDKKDNQYLRDNHKDFRAKSSAILNNDRYSRVTATDGDIKSAVAHGDNYDQDSVSAGEDNVGQIVLALMSFEKLKNEYPDYHGGLLLIDEADAGLFPAAQEELIKLLANVSGKLNLQIVMTSHSPIVLEKVIEYSSKAHNDYKSIYLTNTFGSIQVRQDWGWSRIYSDLYVTSAKIGKDVKIPKINTYFEDIEAADFFEALVIKNSINNVLSKIKNVSLGCDQYLTLIKAGVKEFSKHSLVILDADVDIKVEAETCIKLPGKLPPDQLLFEFLIKLPRDDKFWEFNEYNFTKDVFFRLANPIVQRLDLVGVDGDETFSLSDYLPKTKGELGPVRKDFKKFYTSEEIQALVKGRVKNNPFRYWVEKNQDLREEFVSDLIKRIKSISRKVHATPETDMEAIGK